MQILFALPSYFGSRSSASSSFPVIDLLPSQKSREMNEAARQTLKDFVWLAIACHAYVDPLYAGVSRSTSLNTVWMDIISEYNHMARPF